MKQVHFMPKVKEDKFITVNYFEAIGSKDLSVKS